MSWSDALIMHLSLLYSWRFSRYSAPIHWLDHGHMTSNKLFPTKCNERATLQKLWCQTVNSSLLPAKCWPLLHVIAGISARFSNCAFVLFCFITNHLVTGPLGNSGFCLPHLNVSLNFVSGNIEILGKQNSLFPSGPAVKCLLFS